MANVEPPRDRALDGANLLPLFDEKPITRPHPLYWQYNRAISQPWTISMRDGPWKLLGNAALDRFELYNLADDTGEKTNLAETNPDLVTAMVKVMKKLHAEVAADAAKSGNPPPGAEREKK